MPWTMNDYPNSLKNLPKTARKKAIDIANAMVQEGYREENAIPIATQQAEEWYDKTSTEERQDYSQHANPTKHHPDSSSRPELLDRAELVVPHKDGWAVQAKGAKTASKVFNQKEDAIEYGKKVAKNKQTSLIIQKKDGSQQDQIMYK